MKAMKSGTIFGIFAAAATIVMVPLVAQANDAKDDEIASLKRQIYQCHHHKRHHHRAVSILPETKTIEKETVIEKPVIIEKVVEKQVTVEKPAEKEIVLERPAEIERKVVVEHSAHRKHLIHIGIPFIGVNLF